MNENNVVVQTLNKVYEQQRLQQIIPSQISKQPIKILIISQTKEITNMIKRLSKEQNIWKFKEQDKINYISIRKNVKKFDLSKNVRNNQINPSLIFDDNTQMVKDEIGRSLLKEIKNFGPQDLVIFATEEYIDGRKAEHLIIQILPNILLNRKNYAQILQVDITSLEYKEIQKSFSKLRKIDIINGFSSVIREICDLKIGLAYTRFFTQSVGNKIDNINRISFSFGPCQSPVLNFIIKEENKKLLETQNKYKFILQLEKYNLLLINGQDLQQFNSLKSAQNFGKQIKKVKLVRKEQKRSDHMSVQPLTTQSLYQLGAELNMTQIEIQRIVRNLYERGYITQPNTESCSYNKGNNYYIKLIFKIKGLYQNDQAWKQIIQMININEEKIKNLELKIDKNNLIKEPISPTVYIPSLDQLSKKGAQIYFLILKNFIDSLLHNRDQDLYKYFFRFQKILFETQWLKNIPQISINPNVEYIYNVIDTKAIEGHKGFFEQDIIEKIRSQLGGKIQFAITHINNIYNRGFIRKRRGFIYTTSLGQAYNNLLEKFCQRFISKDSRKELLEQYEEYIRVVKAEYDTISIQQQQELLNNIIKSICKPYKNHLQKIQDQKEQIIETFKKEFENFEEMLVQDSDELIQCKDCNVNMQYNEVFDIIKCQQCNKKQKTGAKNLLLKDRNDMVCLKCNSKLCLLEIPLKITNFRDHESDLKSMDNGYVQVCVGCNEKNNIIDTCQDYILKNCKDCKNSKHLIIYYQNSDTRNITLIEGCMKCKRLFLIEKNLKDFSLLKEKCQQCKDNNIYNLKYNNRNQTKCLRCVKTKRQYIGKMFLKIFQEKK